MKILAIETSCDETACAVVEDGSRILSSVVHSQINIFEELGGVVPEVAARSHIEMILPVIDKALLNFYLVEHLDFRESDWCDEFREKAWKEIDAVACTVMPGLIGSLLVGSLTARTLAIAKNKPFYGIHHVEAHTYANFLTERISRNIELSIDVPTKSISREIALKTEKIRARQPEFPMLGLIVSGGHSQIVLWRDHGNYDLVGQTADDAVGEAFDKVAKILGLPYPGGPSIAKTAENGDSQKYNFPKAKMKSCYDFSFSGLKTAVLRRVQQEVGVDHTFPSRELSGRLTEAQKADFAASFQRVAVETLTDKLELAFREFKPKSVVIAGGVSANTALRDEISMRFTRIAANPRDDLASLAKDLFIQSEDGKFAKIEFSPLFTCTDNAMMIGSLAYFKAKSVAPDDAYSTEVVPSISMAKTAWNK